MKPTVLIAYKSDGATTCRGCVMDTWSSHFVCEWYPTFTAPDFIFELSALHKHNLISELSREERRVWGSGDPDGDFEIHLAVGDTKVTIQGERAEVNYWEEEPDWVPELKKANAAAFAAAKMKIEQETASYKQEKLRKVEEVLRQKEAAERAEFERLKEKFAS